MEEDYLTEAELDATFIDNTNPTKESGVWIGICNDTENGLTINGFRTAKDAYEWIKDDMNDNCCTATDEDGNDLYYVRHKYDYVWGCDDKCIEWEIRFIRNL